MLLSKISSASFLCHEGCDHAIFTGIFPVVCYDFKIFFCFININLEEVKWYSKDALIWNSMGGREVQERGDIRIPMANSYWCMTETNTVLYSNYPPVKNIIKKEKKWIPWLVGRSMNFLPQHLIFSFFYVNYYFMSFMYLISILFSLIAQVVKNPPAMQETPVWFLGEEGPLEKGSTMHFSVLGLPLWLSW